jgi:hypothetical protein
MECREIGQVDPFMEDQRRFNAAISQKQAIAELRQQIARCRHD